jgi:hypothetical protein
VRIDEDVSRLDVAVYEPPPVGGVERFGDLTDKSQSTLGLKRPFLRQNRAKIPVESVFDVSICRLSSERRCSRRRLYPIASELSSPGLIFGPPSAPFGVPVAT